MVGFGFKYQARGENMTIELASEEFKSKIGTVIHQSEWIEISQEMINAFADATDDHQWIHIDTERAAKESPFKATIAHGYFTLSLYPKLRGLVNPNDPPFPGTKNIINYGINKLRFPGPVISGLSLIHI